eukprot:CAMPEP_0197031336 /NCGR_PEP_ID=MMETSP1384-20130603/10375_1 /TAXON_ID=29189 /ORGANISM="Ammonia sp." /LENGTH=70 /DNA_ID=CAMNT_0042460851 /DNA_START=34 /DNA_END=242 /DNA_ORIENTATION=+
MNNTEHAMTKSDLQAEAILCELFENGVDTPSHTNTNTHVQNLWSKRESVKVHEQSTDQEPEFPHTQTSVS